MKKFLLLVLISFLLMPGLQAQKKYEYVSYSHDAMNVRIYTLDNGLKVYLSAYRDAPRIQCLIPVRVGSKNDPAETTGLAHYLEHLMFKGTPHFGTMNWAAEEPLLNEIEHQFELYRHTHELAERERIYHIIDSLSYEASQYAIPNEYGKMMKYIGSQGTNAATSRDYTVYIEDIPANQLENWAVIQADRFRHPIFRIFHTELETVYEEKNTSLAKDNRKAQEALLGLLYPNNAYGKQTTLGSCEHLKNPSITNIKNFYNTYYVPNNMAICLAGDFDYDEAIAVIDKYFGQLTNKPIPHYVVPEEKPITQPVTKEVRGYEEAFLYLAYRLDLPANDPDIHTAEMVENILSNGKCGMLDLNVNQKHLAANTYGYVLDLCDNSSFCFGGKPNDGQTLEEVKDILLEQIELLKKGDFNSNLLKAAVNNMQAQQMRQLQSNRSRANAMAYAFENDIDWYRASQKLDYYQKVTKEDIVKFAKKYFGDNNYVVVYKRQGEPEETERVSKPKITAIHVNRDAESDFFKKIKDNEVKPIEPEFVDFQQSITFDKYKTVPIDYIHNDEDQTFTLKMIFPAGEMNQILLPYVQEYLNRVGTSKLTVEDIKNQFYMLACNYRISVSDEETTVILSGIEENREKAFKLMLNVIENAIPDSLAMNHLKEDVLLQRKNAKSSQNSVMNCLRTYCEYGPELVKYQLSKEQLEKLSGEEVLAVLRQLFMYQPEILYYGPATMKQLKKSLAATYKLPKQFSLPAPAQKFERKATNENVVFYAPYPAKQSRVITSMRSTEFAKELIPVVRMYNQYFGGSMNAIVFQEMREKRSLAYSAQSAFVIPQKQEEYMYNYSYIATQNDKVVDALTAFDSLFNAMPVSQTAFDLAKESAKTTIASNRITKMDILNNYVANRKIGINYDYRKDFYNLIDGFTMKDIQLFNEKYVKKKPKTYMILATEGEVDLDDVARKFGQVKRLTLDEIFGY